MKNDHPNFSKQSKRGQTAVEFILLIAAVAGTVFAANAVISTEGRKIIESLVGGMQSSAWTGGMPTGSDGSPMRSQYDPGGACMAAKGSGSGC